MAALEAAVPLARSSRTVVRVDEQPRPIARPYLVHPQLDTWLVGGLSLIVFAVVASLWPLSSAVPSVGTQLRNLALLAPTLALFVNYPHFIASYRLAYWRRDSAQRHAFALLFVPVVLVLAAVLSYLTFDGRLTFAGYSVDSFGSRLGGWLVGLMFITVGWHYAKQSYGCARVGARLRGFALSNANARALRLSLIPLWVAVWVRSNAGRGSFDYVGLRYGSLDLPRWLIPATNASIVVGALVALGVLISSAHTNARRPPLLMAVPIVAMFVWWIPAAYNPTFFVLIPMFHSLQYLPFASKVERGRTAARHPERRTLRRRLAITAVAIAIVGWVAFEIAPNALDTATHTSQHLGILFFAAMLPVLINVHHYFIDHVIWRRDEPEVFSHLTAAPAPGR